MKTRLATLIGPVLLVLACSDDSANAAPDSNVSPADATADPTVDRADATADPTFDQADAAADPTADGADDPVEDSPPERVNTCIGPAEAAVDNAALPDGYCAWIFADDLSRPRGTALAANGDLLVVERGRARVVALWDADRDGVASDNERAVIAETNGLNHGVAVHDGLLYASSDTRVYRWPYPEGARSSLGDPETVIDSIPGGGHSTRTLVFDTQGRLYVSVGSGSNVDGDASRAGIRRFTLPATGADPVAFGTGELFAEGLRNEVGLTFDRQGRLWGVENGVDNLSRIDLGGDIHNNNPAEELNLFAEPGRFYGYPYCWSEFLLPAGLGQGPGTQFAHLNFIDDGTHTDAWCRNTDNVVPPQFSMQAHAAPLDVRFYTGGSFPDDVVGDALVSFHGSWNRDVPTGYKVVRVRFEAGHPVALEPLFEYGGAGDIDSDWPHRPVGLQVGPSGELYVTSDRSDVVIAIGHTGQ